jgi:hypothetical protein
MIKLGKSYLDVITGFEGIVTGLVEYVSGCNQALLTPKVDAEGKLREAQWFDVQRLRMTGDAAITLDNGRTAGFDKPAPKR